MTRLRDICLVLALLLAPIGIFFPIDHWVAGLFYEGDGSFWLTDSWVGYVFHDILRPTFYWVLAAGLLYLLARSWGMRGHAGLTLRRLAYIVAVLGLGLGLITNTILKGQFDRPRPLHTQAYGGEQTYKPPILPTYGCERNCSFVSGDASAAFAMIALPIAFASGRRRRKLIRAALWLGVAIGLMRMMNGSHYLFDVIYAGLINVGLAAALYRPILGLRMRHIKGLPDYARAWAGSAMTGLRRLRAWLASPGSGNSGSSE